MEYKTNNLTGQVKASSSQREENVLTTLHEDYLGLYHEVKVRGVRIDTLRSFLLRMAEEAMVENLLQTVVALAAKESNFNSRLSFDEVRALLLDMRRYVLSFKDVKGDKLLSDLFKRAFKGDLTHSCKAYYKLCKESQREYVNSLLGEIFVFDVRQGHNIPLAQ